MKQNVCKFKPRRFNTKMTFGGGEISVGCQKNGSFQFYPCRGIWIFSGMTQCQKKSSKNSIFAIHSQIDKEAYFEYTIVIITIECTV